VRNAWRQRHRLFCHEQDVVDEERSAKVRIRVSVPTPESGAVMGIERVNGEVVWRVDHAVGLQRRFSHTQTYFMLPQECPIERAHRIQPVGNNTQVAMLAKDGKDIITTASVSLLAPRASTAKCSRACLVPGEMMVSWRR